MQRLSLFAGGSSLILHLGFATLLAERLRFPESVRPPVTVTVSLAPPVSSTTSSPAQASASLRPMEEPEPAAPNEPAAPAPSSAAEPFLVPKPPAPAVAERVETPEAPATALPVPTALPDVTPAGALSPPEPPAAAINDAPLRPPMAAAQAESPSAAAAEVGMPPVQEASLPDVTPVAAPVLLKDDHDPSPLAIEPEPLSPASQAPEVDRVAAKASVLVAETLSSGIPPAALAPRQGPDESPRHSPTATVAVAAPSAAARDTAAVRFARIVTPAVASPPATMNASPLPVSDPEPPTAPSLAQEGTETMPSLVETPTPLVQQPAAGEAPGAEVPATSVLSSPRSVAEMVGFIDRYDGGSCFFVSAAGMTKDSAEIESFSDSKERVDAFDAAFHAGIGLEANVTGQRVLKSQCPMVDFLKLERGTLAKAPILHIERRYLKDGDMLSGDIRGTGARFVTLLLVSEKGMIQNLSRWLNDRGDAKAFSIPLRHEQTGGKAPQILVAIASTAPLPDMGLSPVTEDGFFRALSEHAFLTQQGVQTAGKLFILTD